MIQPIFLTEALTYFIMNVICEVKMATPQKRAKGPCGNKIDD